jgi:hypothetical protein
MSIALDVADGKIAHFRTEGSRPTDPADVRASWPLRTT